MIQPISIPMLDGRMMNVQVEVEDQVAAEGEVRFYFVVKSAVFYISISCLSLDLRISSQSSSHNLSHYEKVVAIVTAAKEVQRNVLPADYEDRIDIIVKELVHTKRGGENGVLK